MDRDKQCGLVGITKEKPHELLESVETSHVNHTVGYFVRTRMNRYPCVNRSI